MYRFYRIVRDNKIINKVYQFRNIAILTIGVSLDI